MRLIASHVAAAIAIALTLAVSGCFGEPVDPAEVTVEDVIEALFLGQGRAGAEGGCIEDVGGEHTEGVWRTFARGSDVRLVLGASVADLGRIVLEREMDTFNTAVAGFFTVTIESDSALDPIPGPSEITSADFNAVEVAARCDGNGQGCALVTAADGSTLVSVRTFQGLEFPGTSHVHEVGHALGLCHVSPVSVPNAVMGRTQMANSNRFVALERQAIERVFAAGLRPGATRADFQRAGLIR